MKSLLTMMSQKYDDREKEFDIQPDDFRHVSRRCPYGRIKHFTRAIFKHLCRLILFSC